MFKSSCSRQLGYKKVIYFFKVEELKIFIFIFKITDKDIIQLLVVLISKVEKIETKTKQVKNLPEGVWHFEVYLQQIP